MSICNAWFTKVLHSYIDIYTLPSRMRDARLTTACAFEQSAGFSCRSEKSASFDWSQRVCACFPLPAAFLDLKIYGFRVVGCVNVVLSARVMVTELVLCWRDFQSTRRIGAFETASHKAVRSTYVFALSFRDRVGYGAAEFQS